MAKLNFYSRRGKKSLLSIFFKGRVGFYRAADGAVRPSDKDGVYNTQIVIELLPRD